MPKQITYNILYRESDTAHSTAILTPDLSDYLSSDFKARRHDLNGSYGKVKAPPLKPEEIEQIKKWCKNQFENFKFNPSNAVLVDVD